MVSLAEVATIRMVEQVRVAVIALVGGLDERKKLLCV